MEWLTDYSLFAAQFATAVLLLMLPVLFIIGAIMSHRSGDGRHSSGRLHIEDLSSLLQALKKELTAERDDSPKQSRKARKKERKQEAEEKKKRPRIYVLDFSGDIQASGSEHLREEVSSVLLAQREGDEVLVRLDSRGGMVSGYGLVSAQLKRLRSAKVPLTVAVDEVAASGGYLAACVADRILAAPFAMIGSIGVLMQIPNLHRFLKKHDVDFEMMTAGKNKRNVTMFGEVTDAERKKAQHDIDEVHQAFLDVVKEQRPNADMKKIGEGDVWLAEKAMALGLVDEIGTSDDWLLARLETHQLLRLEWRPKINLMDRLRQRPM